MPRVKSDQSSKNRDATRLHTNRYQKSLLMKRGDLKSRSSKIGGRHDMAFFSPATHHQQDLYISLDRKD